MASSRIYEEDYDTDSVIEVDSDVESNFADSPSDGYFSERQHPRETFVENSSISAEAEAKARERAEERASSSAALPPSQLSSPASSRESVAWTDAETPLINQEPPPPDYESATSGRQSTQIFNNSSQHPYSQSQTFLSQQQDTARQFDRPQDGEPFIANGGPVPAHLVTIERNPIQPPHPQSMMDSTPQQIIIDEESGLLTGRKGKPSRRRWRLCGKSMSLCNIILFAAIIILVILIAGASEDRNESDKPKPPDKGNDDDEPSNPLIPPIKPSPPSSIPPPTRKCPYKYYSEETIFDFEKPQNFSFVELLESSEWASGGINGKVIIGPAQGEQDVDIRMWVAYATTKSWEIVNSNFVKTDESLVLQLPTMKRTGEEKSKKKPCMWLHVRIEVRPGVKLNGWEIAVGNLDIEVKEGLFNKNEGEEELSVLRVGGPAVFNAIRGRVDVAYWSSRETEVDVISGSIKGTFALLDLLSLKTQSGSLNVNVDPKKADPNRIRPAEFLAKTHSGSLKVHFPQDGYIPQRQYSTRVETSSASIAGNYILGELTSFHTLSGSINADVLPFFDRKMPATLRSDSRSGSTQIHVLSPYDYPGEPWPQVQFTHKSTSTSGTIDVAYPEDWTGMIEGQSISGSINIRGKDVKVLSDYKSGAYRHLMASKGWGSGKMGLKSSTGSVKVKFADD